MPGHNNVIMKSGRARAGQGRVGFSKSIKSWPGQAVIHSISTDK